MKEVHALRWKKEREVGFGSCVLKRGVLGWGLPMCVAFVFMQWQRNPRPLTEILLINVPLWLFMGSLFGVAMWYAMEWQYKRYVAKHGEPHLS